MIHGQNYLIFKILLIAPDWNFLRTAPLPVHQVKKCHILRWYEWDLLVVCKQTPF